MSRNVAKAHLPQVEDGYTRIANELLDAILRQGFSKREITLALAVIRKTYGFNKKTDDMTMTQLSNMTGVKLSHVSETIRDLAARQVFLFREGRHGYVIGINKDYAKWLGSQNRNHLPKTGTSTSQNGNIYFPKREPQKTTPKDNPKRNIDRLFDHWYSHYPNKKAKGQAKKAFRRLNPDEVLVERMIAAVQAQKAEREAAKANGEWVPEWKHPGTWLNAESWEDEVSSGGLPDWAQEAI